jgi:hypothetical protein
MSPLPLWGPKDPEDARGQARPVEGHYIFQPLTNRQNLKDMALTSKI